MLATKKKIMNNEKGFAAILIAMILITVLSLLTVGFAELMRTSTTNALNRQLSVQAYDAAESGVNAAAAAINAGYPDAKTTCDISGVFTSHPGSSYLKDNTVGGTNGSTAASYPCLLINPTPTSYKKSPIDTVNSTIAEMQGIDPSTGIATKIQTMEISWQNAQGSDSFLTSANQCNNLYPAGASWPYTGMLRAELVSINDVTRNGLINNALTTFLCPSTSAANTVAYNTGTTGTNSGTIISGACSTPNTTNPQYCNAYITGLGALNEDTFFLVLRSIYKTTAATVTLYGKDGTSSVTAGNILNIKDAQYLIDSTGKAQNVLKRIQVRIPTHNNYYYAPNGAIAGVCKQLSLTPDSSSSSAPCSPIP